MPGDWSSVSRFVRAAFLLSNSPRFSSKNEAVSQFFHLLSAVEQPKGAVQERADNRIITEQTAYSSCCDSALGVYYYRTYDRWQLTAVDMHKFDLEKDCLYFVPMLQA